MTQPRLETRFDGSTLMARVSGDCTIEHAGILNEQLGAVCQRARKPARVVFECAGLGTMDTSGAWLLQRTAERLKRQGVDAELSGFRDAHFRAMRALPASDGEPCRHRRFDTLERVEQMGRLIVAGGRHLVEATGFLGHLTVTTAQCIADPRRLRLGTMIAAMDRAGVSALPIVALLSFLISVALTYQGATQLREFGAEVLTVDLVAVSVLRELGVVLTAVLVAGRSGSAFAAQIGVMELNEEIEAMETMGMDPMEVLVLPRVVALVVMMPLLTIAADVAGLAGGAVSAAFLLDLPLSAYLPQVQNAITAWTVWSGIIKAPIFGALIATTSCFWGFKASGSAASVGHLTTVSVVQSIFLVVTADAAISVIYSILGL